MCSSFSYRAVEMNEHEDEGKPGILSKIIIIIGEEQYSKLCLRRRNYFHYESMQSFSRRLCMVANEA
jgi:hypothetical protein